MAGKTFAVQAPGLLLLLIYLEESIWEQAQTWYLGLSEKSPGSP